MFATPAPTPVTTPVLPAVATVVILLAHVPPASASDNVVALSAQTVCVPVIVEGNGFTVIAFVMIQPELKRYDIVVVPAKIPVTIPEVDPIVAAEVLLLDHNMPPELASVNGVVEPTHTEDAPDIADGNPVIVMFFVLKQPELIV